MSSNGVRRRTLATRGPLCHTKPLRSLPLRKAISAANAWRPRSVFTCEHSIVGTRNGEDLPEPRLVGKQFIELKPFATGLQNTRSTSLALVICRAGREYASAASTVPDAFRTARV